MQSSADAHAEWTDRFADSAGAADRPGRTIEIGHNLPKEVTLDLARGSTICLVKQFQNVCREELRCWLLAFLASTGRRNHSRACCGGCRFFWIVLAGLSLVP